MEKKFQYTKWKAQWMIKLSCFETTEIPLTAALKISLSKLHPWTVWGQLMKINRFCSVLIKFGIPSLIKVKTN
jgi:hypothetical protein